MRGRSGETALHHAAEAGADDIVTLLIAHGAPVNLRDLKGSTALYQAAEANRAKTTRLLIEKGADPNIEGRAGVTPLEAAAFNGNDRLVDFLLQARRRPAPCRQDREERHRLRGARGFTAIVSRLIAAGSEVNARYGNDLTALMWAAGYSNDVPDCGWRSDGQLLLDQGRRATIRTIAGGARS